MVIVLVVAENCCYSSVLVDRSGQKNELEYRKRVLKMAQLPETSANLICEDYGKSRKFGFTRTNLAIVILILETNKSTYPL